MTAEEIPNYLTTLRKELKENLLVFDMERFNQAYMESLDTVIEGNTPSLELIGECHYFKDLLKKEHTIL